MKRIVAAFLCGILLIAFSGCAVNDGPETANGKTDYQTLVATSVSTCEVLEKLGISSDRVVGIPETSAYTIPKVYEKAETIGSPMGPDMEVLKSLSPDLVLGPKSLEDSLRSQYEDIGVDSYFLDLTSVDGMYASIAELGPMLGAGKAAKKLVSDYETFKADYQKKHSHGDAPTVLILMGLPGSYVVATESSYAGSLVKLAGGENVYGDGDGEAFLNINPEDMLKKEPDIILRTSHAMPDQVKKMFAKEFKTNDIWQHFEAVQNDRVYDLSNELFGMSASFRYEKALDTLAPILFGE